MYLGWLLNRVIKTVAVLQPLLGGTFSARVRGYVYCGIGC